MFKGRKLALFDLISPYFVGGRQVIFCSHARYFRNLGMAVDYWGGNRFYAQVLNFFQRIVFGLESAWHGQKYQPPVFSKAKRDLAGINCQQTTAGIFFPFLSPGYYRVRRQLQLADVIYSSNELPDLIALYNLIGRRHYKKVIIGMHTAVFLPAVTDAWSRLHNLFYLGWIYRGLLKRAGALQVTNRDDARQLVDRLRVPANNIHYIPDQLHTDWEQETIRPIIAGNFKMIFMGRLTTQKGVKYLTNLIAKMRRDNFWSNAELTIVGPPGSEDKILKTALSGQPAIKYLKYCSDMKQLYRRHDIAIVTSLWETFGYNVLEPQSLGLPVVAFDVPGPRDIVKDQETGYLVKPFAVEAFYKRIIELKQWKQEGRACFVQMGLRAYSRARKLFGHTQANSKLENLVSQIANKSTCETK